jgi:hypothetical protein
MFNRSSRARTLSRGPTVDAIGRVVPQPERKGESKYMGGRTNIDCNDIGVPHAEGQQLVGASARSSMHRR